MKDAAAPSDAAAALARAEAALRTIATTANHDLNAPVRHIQIYIELLEREHGLDLGEAGRDYLGRIQSAAGRLNALIERLVDFARVVSAPVEGEVLDLNALAAAAASKTRVQVDVAPMPPAFADRNQIRRVFDELFANAAEFAPGAQIRVSGRIMGPGWIEVRVEDDGPGIAQEHAEAVFDFLRRPPPADPQEARGAGLAVCRHLVESHGGRIRVDSAGRSGAAFIFTLPHTAPDAD